MAVAHRMAAFFERFGVPATWAPSDYSDVEEALVILDQPGEILLGGTAQHVAYLMTYPADKFVGLAREEKVSIGDVSYTVRQVLPEPGTDGLTMWATLSRDDAG